MKIRINQKYLLLTLSGLLIAGVIFSVVQVILAGVTGPHNPGHIWATIDKPADCSSGYVYGANDSGWLCSTPTITETDPQVGTLTNGMWCTTNGTQVNCTSSAPSVTAQIAHGTTYGLNYTLYPISGFSKSECSLAVWKSTDNSWAGETKYRQAYAEVIHNASSWTVNCLFYDDATQQNSYCGYTMICVRGATGG